jgi:non-homologous end joining protein Ku
MDCITEHILETKKEDFNPAYLEDRYHTVLVEKLREKQSSGRAQLGKPRDGEIGHCVHNMMRAPGPR